MSLWWVLVQLDIVQQPLYGKQEKRYVSGCGLIKLYLHQWTKIFLSKQPHVLLP